MSDTFIDPFDDPDYRPGTPGPAPLPQGSRTTLPQGFVDPFDDPQFQPGPPDVPPIPPPMLPPLEQQQPTAVQRATRAFSGFITGRGRPYEGMPELVGELSRQQSIESEAARQQFGPIQGEMRRTPRGEQLRSVLTAAAVPSSPLGKATALMGQPGVEDVRVSEEGDVLVTFEGNQYIINAPGVSPQDLRELGMDVAFEAPLAVPGARVGKAALGAAGAALGAGGGVFAGAAARDVIGGGRLDLIDAAIKGGAATAFELLNPIIGPALRSLFRNSRFVKDGRLTDEGRVRVSDLGIEPNEVTPEFIEVFRSAPPEDVAAAARMAEAQALPAPVRLTRGQATGDPIQQSLEDAAARSGLGSERLQREMIGARTQQEEALGANVPAIQQRIAGPEAPIEMGQGIGQAQRELARQRGELAGQVREAYDIAKKGTAAVTGESVEDIGDNVVLQLGEDYNELTAPKAFAMAGRLPGLGRGKEAVGIRSLENWRQQVAALARSNDRVESAAAKRLLSLYDEAMDSTIDDALLRGTPEDLEAFQRARRLRRELFKKFEQDKLLARIVDTEDGELLLTPSEAYNVIFTASGLGGKRGATRALRRMKELLPEAQWNALRQESLLRLFRNQPEEGFSAAKFKTAWRKANQDAPELVKTLFTPQERQLINRFARVAGYTLPSPQATINRSQTANLMGLLDRMGFLGRNVREIIEGRIGLVTPEQARARRGITTPVERQPMVPPGAAGVAGAGVVDPMLPFQGQPRRQ